MHLLREGQHLRVGKVHVGHGRRCFLLSRWSTPRPQDPMLRLFIEALGQCLARSIVDLEKVRIQ